MGSVLSRQDVSMRVSVASDHGGFEQKQQIVQHLLDGGVDVADRGPQTADSVDYPDFAELVARDVASEDADFGILVCGTGIGMSIAANKIDGIRAANVTTKEFAHLAREHNNANVLTLSGRFVPVEDNITIVDEFLQTAFGEGRHARRVQKIMALEAPKGSK